MGVVHVDMGWAHVNMDADDTSQAQSRILYHCVLRSLQLPPVEVSRRYNVAVQETVVTPPRLPPHPSSLLLLNYRYSVCVSIDILRMYVHVHCMCVQHLN